MGLWREDTSYGLGITSSILGGYSYGFQDIEISGVRACCWPIGMASNGEIQMKQATAISWRWTHPRTKSGEGHGEKVTTEFSRYAVYTGIVLAFYVGRLIGV